MGANAGVIMPWVHRDAIGSVMRYTGCPQKSGTSDFQYLASSKCHIVLTPLDKASSAEENDTKIIKFDWVILNLCPLLEIQSFSNFAWFLRPMSEELCRDKASIRCFGEAHWSVATKETRINMGFHKTPYGRLFPSQFFARRSQKSS